MQKNGAPSNKDLEEYVAAVKSKSENLIKSEIPRKIKELNELLDSDQFSFEHQLPLVKAAVVLPPKHHCDNNHVNTTAMELEKCHLENGINCNGAGEYLTASSSSTVPVNAIVSKGYEIIKIYVRDLAEHANLLKLWLNFLIPNIEDGNNFGVSIQERVLEYIKETDSSITNSYAWFEGYHIHRAKMASKVIKYPGVDDYRKVLEELDMKNLFYLRDHIATVRNRYVLMYDLIVKNWEKILVPRSSNAENLY